MHCESVLPLIHRACCLPPTLLRFASLLSVCAVGPLALAAAPLAAATVEPTPPVSGWLYDGNYSDPFGFVDGGPIGNPQFVPGGPFPGTQALSLSGEFVRQYVAHQVVDEHRITGAITVSVWVNTTENEDFGYVFNRWQATVPLRSWAVRVDHGRFTVTLSRDGAFTSAVSQQVAANALVNDGQWHHLAFTWDPVNQLRMYINGALVPPEGLSIVRNPALPELNDPDTIAVRVGNRSSATAASQYSGLVAEAGIWDRVLEPEEVAWLAANSMAGLPMPPPPPPPAIQFNQDFDSGALNIALTVVEDGDGTAPTITLAPRQVGWAGRWYHFDVIGVEGKRPTFRVPLVGDGTSAHTSSHRYLYSYDDGVTYHYFSDGGRLDGFFQFTPDAPFPQDTVRIAYSRPYPVSRTLAHLEQIADSPFVAPLDSAIDGFAYGHTLGTAGGHYTDELGRVIPALPLVGFRITDPGVPDANKLNIVLTSGAHASETTAHLVLEGAINFLVGDDPVATALRERIVFLVYPQVNPEGRWAGYTRSGPQAQSRDVNRDWLAAPLHTSVALTQAAILQDSGGTAAISIDFHNTRTGVFEIWVHRDRGDSVLGFLEAFRTFRPQTSRLLTTIVNSISSWNAENLGTRASFTSETGFLAGWSIEDYHDLGADYMRALDMVLEPAGQIAYAAWIGRNAGLEPTELAPLANPSGDGIPNVLKYVLGLDPAASARAALPAPWTEQGIEGTSIVFDVLLNPDALVVPGLTVTIESGDSPDTGWQPLDPAHIEPVSAGHLRARLPTDSAENRFLRIRVDGVEVLGSP